MHRHFIRSYLLGQRAEDVSFFITSYMSSMMLQLTWLRTLITFCAIFITRSKQQDFFNLLGAMYSALFFLGASNANAVLPVVGVERTVFYRERAAGMYSAIPYAIGQVTERAAGVHAF